MPSHTTTFREPARILARLDARSVTTPSGCKIWQGACDKFGYGRISTPEGTMYAHRARWVALHGAIGDPHRRVWHTCGNRACTEETHLILALFPCDDGHTL
jgi:hypothetical protein